MELNQLNRVDETARYIVNMILLTVDVTELNEEETQEVYRKVKEKLI